MNFDKFAGDFWNEIAKHPIMKSRGYLTPNEFYDHWLEYWKLNKPSMKPDYLTRLSTMNNVPIFETKEFTFKQRKKIFGKGQELYFKRMLQWRFGQKRGGWVYWVSRITKTRWLLLRIVHTKIGHQIFLILSHQTRWHKTK